MVMEPQPPPDLAPQPVAAERRLTRGERMLFWIGLLMPALTSPAAVFGFIMFSYSVGSDVAPSSIAVAAVWLAFVIGCCWLCGWINAVKQGPEGRNARAWKQAGFFFLGQLLLTPTLGFGTCMAIAGVSSL
jgi:hypothetical protein